MTVMAWLRLTVCLWLLRKTARAAGWLLLALLLPAADGERGGAAGRERGWVRAKIGEVQETDGAYVVRVAGADRPAQG